MPLAHLHEMEILQQVIDIFGNNSMKMMKDRKGMLCLYSPDPIMTQKFNLCYGGVEDVTESSGCT